MNHEINYPTDEELMLMIESAETDFFCHAPDYLKEQILQKNTKQRITPQLFFFSVKVVAAAAAAIALLIVMPETARLEHLSQNTLAARRQTETYRQEDSLLHQLNQKTYQFGNLLYDTTNSIFFKEDD